MVGERVVLWRRVSIARTGVFEIIMGRGSNGDCVSTVGTGVGIVMDMLIVCEGKSGVI